MLPKSHSRNRGTRLELRTQGSPPRPHPTMKSKLRNFPGVSAETVLVVLTLLLLVTLLVRGG